MAAQAGEIDGVVSLTGQNRAAVERASQAVAEHLRRRMPALEFSVSEPQEAPDYFAAYLPLRQGAAVVWQPAAAEAVFAAPCRMCGVDAGVQVRVVGPESGDERVCGDCAARVDSAGRSSSRRRQDVPRGESVLEGLLIGTAAQGAAFPDDFGELAELDADQTHIATIFIDGNRIGMLLDSLGGASGDAKARVARAVAGSAAGALRDAVLRIHKPGQPTLPVAVHLIGGDDVLVSVPALRALPFTTAFLQGFRRQMWRYLQDEHAGKPVPTASAGIVWHHRSHPFGLALESAESALTQAKSGTRGREASVAWIDVTAEGAGPDAVAGPRSLSWLDGNADALEGLAALPAAQRARLSRLPDAQMPEQLRRRGSKAAQQLWNQHPSDLRDGLRLVRWTP